MKPVALINTAAGRGRGISRIREFRALLDASFEQVRYEETTGVGQEGARIDAALADGCDCVLALGGDGTWSIVADHLLRTGRPGVPLGLLPAGTGNDFGKSLSITYDQRAEVVRAIAAGRRRRVDVGRVEGRHFLNVVGMGFDIAVIHDAQSVGCSRAICSTSSAPSASCFVIVASNSRSKRTARERAHRVRDGRT